MLHPDLMLQLAQYQHRDRLDEVETWRLAQAAREHQARYVSQLFQHLVTALRQRRQVRAQPQPDLAKLPR